MALLAPQNGDLLLLRYLLNNQSPANAVLHLYTNNHVPAETDTLNNYTESSAAGYPAGGCTLVGGSWSFATGASGATGTYSTVTFSYTGPENLYGYFVTSGATLSWSEAFAGSPWVLPSPGATVSVVPRIALD